MGWTNMIRIISTFLYLLYILDTGYVVRRETVTLFQKYLSIVKGYKSLAFD
jgi:hypothetical protein